MNNLRIILMIAVVGIIFGSAAKVFAQTTEPMVGGYKTIEVTAKEVVAAADFAVKKQAKMQKADIKIVAVNHAAQQVVAGMNYQVCLSIETTDRRTKTRTPQTVQTVIFRDLKGKYKLTSWAIAACTDAAPVAAPTN